MPRHRGRALHRCRSGGSHLGPRGSSNAAIRPSCSTTVPISLPGPSPTGAASTASARSSSTRFAPGRTPGSYRSTVGFRDELLNAWRFDSLLEAKVLIEDWRIDYNVNRPYGAKATSRPASSPRLGSAVTTSARIAAGPFIGASSVKSARLAKPGGTLLFGVSVYSTLGLVKSRQVTCRLHAHDFNVICHPPSFREDHLPRLLAAAGWRITYRSPTPIRQRIAGRVYRGRLTVRGRFPLRS